MRSMTEHESVFFFLQLELNYCKECLQDYETDHQIIIIKKIYTIIHIYEFLIDYFFYQ